MKLRSLIAHEWRLITRNRMHIAYIVGLFVMFISIYPLAVEPDAALLHNIGAGVLWMSLLLVVTLATDSVFDTDYQRGILTQWLLTPITPTKLFVAKAVAIYLAYALPLVIMSPVLMLFYGYNAAAIQALLPPLLLGAALLVLLGVLANMLLLGVKHGRFIGICVLLPMYVPIIILGAGTLTVQARGDSLFDHNMLFVGLLFVLLPVTLGLAGACLRAAVAEE